MKYFLIPVGVAIAGWALGMWQASTICAKQGESLMETHDNPKGKTSGSDVVLRNQAASCFGLTFAIRIWLRPWLWGRPWNDFRRKWVIRDRRS